MDPREPDKHSEARRRFVAGEQPQAIARALAVGRTTINRWRDAGGWDALREEQQRLASEHLPAAVAHAHVVHAEACTLDRLALATDRANAQLEDARIGRERLRGLLAEVGSPSAAGDWLKAARELQRLERLALDLPDPVAPAAPPATTAGASDGEGPPQRFVVEDCGRAG